MQMASLPPWFLDAGRRPFLARISSAGGVALLALAFRLPAAEPASARDYATVEAIVARHCLDCHAAQDPEAELVLETFETLMKGGEHGPVIVPGNSAGSLLVKMVEGVERDGKKKI